MILHTHALTDLVVHFLLPFTRISALVMVMPIFGAALVPKRVKILLSFAISLVVFSTMIDGVAQLPKSFDLLHMVTLVLQQIVLGVALGLSIHIIFQAFVVGGQIVAMQMGLGFASMNDPQNGVSVPVVGQFYLMIVTLLYLSINGHLYAFSTIVQSFEIFPLYELNIFKLPIMELISLSSWIFWGAVKVALPAITALLIVNLSIGVMTKAAPQLNVFSIGFPLTMILGIIILWFSTATFLPEFNDLVDEVHSDVSSWGVNNE